MSWFQTLDVAVFRFINGGLSNPVFDKLMPFVSGNQFFIPAVVLLAILLIWKGGTRGRLCLFFALVAVALGDGWICKMLKEAVARPRPFIDIPDAHLLVGRGRTNGFPSSHAANWFAATMVAFIFYRRSWRFMLPFALLVCFSRVYVGVHYLSDVLGGAILGAGYAAAFVWMGNRFWQFVGKKFFPIWWEKIPSLTNPVPRVLPENPASLRPTLDQPFLRLGYILIFGLFAFRLFYIASGTIELSEDEAYQWTWSKHLAPSYYSKPPLIAYTQFLGTKIWGDTELGVRFFSPVVAAILSFLLLRFLARQTNARVALIFIIVLTATPLTSVGAILMTIDPLSVLFWTTALLAGWRAVQDEGTTRDWFWVGIWMGLGFLSKYTNLFQLLCWIVFFLLWPPARKQLCRPGPYLAAALVAVSLLPVLIWNSQHGWITVSHVADNGGLDKWKPTLRYTMDFFTNEAVLLNPVFLGGMLFAAIAMWFSRREKSPLQIFLFSMGVPVFLFYLALSFNSRILPNWIAPSVVPLFLLTAIYLYRDWPRLRRVAKPVLVIGIIGGLFVVTLLHQTDLIEKIFKRSLPAQMNPTTRLRAWKETASAVGSARQKLAAEGTPTFIIGSHYGIVGELSFYLPEAKRNVGKNPLVFYRLSSSPKNQFYFWPGYESRVGQNAIYVRQIDLPKLGKNWWKDWLAGKHISQNEPAPEQIPSDIASEFRSVTDLGVADIFYEKRWVRRVQIIECRDFLGLKK